MKQQFLIVLGPFLEAELAPALSGLQTIGALHSIQNYSPDNPHPKPKKQSPTGITRMKITDDVKKNMRGLRSNGYNPRQIAELIGCSAESVKRHAFAEPPA